MRLVMLYQIEGDERLFCDWRKVNEEEAKYRLRIVIDFVRNLPKWENCVFLGFKRDTPEPDSPVEAHFRQGVSDVGEGKERKRMIVRFYLGHRGEGTTPRDEFCQVADEILKDAPEHIRRFFKNFARDPQTTDEEIDEATKLLLEKGLSEISTLIH